MNKRVRKIVSFISTICLLTASMISLLPGNVFADAQHIQVTPYPQTAGQLASYRVAFNVNESLKAGTDSITVVFPKETNIDSTISSANISVNPKLLNGADFELDYKTGTLKLLNPLRKGDRLTVSYRYEPSAGTAQLPKNIKFYDQSYTPPLPFTPTDLRSGNGILDSGEWVYEDRDNDGKISVGDRRLNIVIAPNQTTTAMVLYRQGSLVQSFDNDFGLGPDPTRPLTQYNVSSLTFVDRDNDGNFTENDWLIDDKDGNGYLSTNDKIIVGMFYYPKNSVVTSNDLDANLPPNPVPPPNPPTAINTPANAYPLGGVVRYVDNVNKNGFFDDGEYVYQDVDNDNKISIGDVRYNWVSASGMVYPKQSRVLANDKDIGILLVNFQATPTYSEYEINVDILASRFYSSSNPAAVTVAVGDKRLNNILNAAFSPGFFGGNTVSSIYTDPDDNITLFPFASNEKFVSAIDPLAGTIHDYNPQDPIYRDLDLSGNVSEFDLRLTKFSVIVDGKEVTYTAGSTVRKGEIDIGQTLTSFPIAITPTSTQIFMHTEIGIPNNKFDIGERIYSNTAVFTNSTGATRLDYFGVISANFTVGSNYPDAGHTLTKGWADVITETLTTYADGGERTFKLTNYPVGKAITPPITDINYSVEPLTLASGLMRGIGKTYYCITAVNETIGESEPWDERMVEFLPSTTFNSVRIKWSPVQNASKYRIYRTNESGSYDDSSMVAEILSPQTEYVDVGGNLLPGKPPTTFESTYTTLILARIDPKTGLYLPDEKLNEYELSDYKLDPVTGKIDFRKPLKLLDTIVADYDTGVRIKDEKIIIDTISGRAKLRYDMILDPDIYGTDDYNIEVHKATSANPDNPTLLVRGVDYEFLDENNDKILGLEKGKMVFFGQIAPTDTVTINYVYRKQVRGDLVKVATGNETALYTHERAIIPGTDEVFKGRTLSSVPVINVMNSEKGPVVTFTTPVNIKPDPANKIGPTPESRRDVNITFSMQTGIRNPNKAGNYQLYVRTSKEQTEIMSNPYVILAGEATQKLVKLTQDQSVSAGSSVALTTAVQDDLGNNIPNMTVVFSIISSPNNGAKLDKTTFVTDSSGKAVAMLTTPTTPGESVVQARLSATNQTVTFRINGLSSQPITKIVVTPATVKVLPNGSIPFTAVAYDGSNNVVPNVDFAWSVNPVGMGTVTDAGYFTAGTITGPCDVSADAFGVRGTAKVTIASQSGVSRIVITPDSASMKVNESKQFIATAYDENNAPISNPSIFWSVRPAEMGIITNTGIFTAIKKGAAQIVASLEGKEGYANVTVTDVPQDTEGPIITMIYPTDNMAVTEPNIIVKGTVTDASGVQVVRVNGITATYNVGTGAFSAPIVLVSGNNTILVNAVDNVGNASTKSVNVILSSPIVIKLQIGVKTAIVIKDGQSNFITIDLAPFTTSSRTMVPLRFIAEAFGADVKWVEDVPRTGEGRIIITLNKKNGMTIVLDMHTNSRYIRKTITQPGESPVEEVVDYPQTEPAPYIVKSVGRTVVPLRFISEAFGSKVDWDAATQGITITFTP